MIVWTRWGRVGVAGQNKFEPKGSLDAAISGFKKKFNEKTKNNWDNRANFKKVSGKYDLIEMDYGNEAEADDEELKEKLAEKRKARENTTCKTEPRVAELVKLMFDMKMFESTLLSMVYMFDPLYSYKHRIWTLRRCHSERSAKLRSKRDTMFYQRWKNFSRRATLHQNKSSVKSPASSILVRVIQKTPLIFNQVIPHDFGFKAGPVIGDKESLQQKLDLLEVLSDMEVAQQMIEKEAKQDVEHPIDCMYIFQLITYLISQIQASPQRYRPS